MTDKPNVSFSERCLRGGVGVGWRTRRPLNTRVVGPTSHRGRGRRKGRKGEREQNQSSGVKESVRKRTDGSTSANNREGRVCDKCYMKG